MTWGLAAVYGMLWEDLLAVSLNQLRPVIAVPFLIAFHILAVIVWAVGVGYTVLRRFGSS